MSFLRVAYGLVHLRNREKMMLCVDDTFSQVLNVPLAPLSLVFIYRSVMTQSLMFKEMVSVINIVQNTVLNLLLLVHQLLYAK